MILTLPLLHSDHHPCFFVLSIEASAVVMEMTHHIRHDGGTS